MTSLAAFMLMQSPVSAQVAVADDVIAQIEADGYTINDVTRSWLGRIVITASNSSGQREVVLNRTSGEVLRDQTFPSDGSDFNAPAPPSGNPAGPPGGPGGPGGRGG